MLKKTITYPDVDGNEVTEDFYFNLSKAEIAEMELSTDGGWSEYLMRIIKTKDVKEIMTTFKSIITQSLGRRSEDGRRFIKSEEIIQDFLHSEAYSVLFMELVTNADAAVKFVTAIVPQDLAEIAALSGANEEVPAYIRENRAPTSAELQAMTKEELQAAFQFQNNRKLVPETLPVADPGPTPKPESPAITE